MDYRSPFALPSELLVPIFSMVDTQTLLRTVSLVCHSWAETLTRNPVLWQAPDHWLKNLVIYGALPEKIRFKLITSQKFRDSAFIHLHKGFSTEDRDVKTALVEWAHIAPADFKMLTTLCPVTGGMLWAYFFVDTHSGEASVRVLLDGDELFQCYLKALSYGYLSSSGSTEYDLTRLRLSGWNRWSEEKDGIMTVGLMKGWPDEGIKKLWKKLKGSKEDTQQRFPICQFRKLSPQGFLLESLHKEQRPADYWTRPLGAPAEDREFKVCIVCTTEVAMDFTQPFCAAEWPLSCHFRTKTVKLSKNDIVWDLRGPLVLKIKNLETQKEGTRVFEGTDIGIAEEKKEKPKWEGWGRNESFVINLVSKEAVGHFHKDWKLTELKGVTQEFFGAGTNYRIWVEVDGLKEKLYSNQCDVKLVKA